MSQSKDVSLTQRKKELKADINQKMKKRTDKMLVLGEMTYKKMRSADVEAEHFEQIHEELLQLDQAVSVAKRDLVKLMAQFEKRTCECGNEIGEQDQFCGECGAKVVKEEPLTDENSITCLTCEEPIPNDSNFCPVCGHTVESGV